MIADIKVILGLVLLLGTTEYWAVFRVGSLWRVLEYANQVIGGSRLGGFSGGQGSRDR